MSTMPDIQLTKDADALICVIYKEYLKKRESGIAKGEAKWFGGSDDLQKTFLPKWTPEDVDETCLELQRANLLACQCADNTVSECILSDSAIIYMERRFTNGLRGVLDYLKTIKSILLW